MQPYSGTYDFPGHFQRVNLEFVLIVSGSLLYISGKSPEAYGKKILSALATKLTAKYGRNFAERNIYRMNQIMAYIKVIKFNIYRLPDSKKPSWL